MNKHSSKEIKAVEKLNEDLAKVRNHVKEIIFGQDEVVDKIIISGDHRLKWIPSDDLAAGVYVVRIHNGSKVLNQRITFLK